MPIYRLLMFRALVPDFRAAVVFCGGEDSVLRSLAEAGYSPEFGAWLRALRSAFRAALVSGGVPRRERGAEEEEEGAVSAAEAAWVRRPVVGPPSEAWKEKEWKRATVSYICGCLAHLIERLRETSGGAK